MAIRSLPLSGLALLGLLAAPGYAPAGRASRWIAPTTISRPGADALTARIALDGDGDAVVVWARAKGRAWVVQAAYRPFGGRWQPPRDLSRPSPQAGAPQVAFDAAGNATAVWQRQEGTRLVVQAATRDVSTGRWSAPQNLSSRGEDAVSPAVALGRRGDAVAVWAQKGASRWSIQAAVRPRGRRWQPPEVVAAALEEAVSPQVVFDAEGAAVAAWAALVGTNWSVEIALRPPDGGWQARPFIAEAGENPRIRLELAADARGQVYALWEGSSGGRSVVQAAVRSASHRWSAVSTLSGEASNAVSPQLAVDARGDAVAVWTRSNGRNWVVRAAQRPAGGPWEPARTISPAGGDAVAPDVALDPRGNAVAVWVRSDGQHSIAQASSASAATGAWSPARNLSQPGGDAVAPVAAMDADGNGTIVWSRFDGSEFAAQAAGYDGSGPELRELSVPSSGVAGASLGFSVLPVDAWSRVTGTRWSFGDGTSARGAWVEHVYSAPGRYTVRVTSVDALGLRTTASQSILVTSY